MSEIRYKTVLLDADGTVYDFHKAEKTALKQTFTQIGIEWTEERNQIYLEENKKIWKEFEQNLLSPEKFKTERFRRFFNKINLSIDLDSKTVNGVYVDNLSKCGFLFDGAFDFVRTLKKYCKVYIATNGLTIAQQGRYKNSGLDNITDGIFISELMGIRKPAKAYFDYIFNELNITDKQSVIMIGDSLSSDMQGGRNAEITTCLYNPQHNITENPLCDFVAYTYDEILINIIKNHS
ncbi:MAG: YjjG family noncanonical pyrimidine nucleotidase [Clostridia bacterium]|nr:YjjG family noncanonical pyrimidine nucleotidase [Clostridia bacterium]